MAINTQTICDADFCISCGGCTHTCVKNNLRMVYKEDKGKWEPRPLNNEKCIKCTSTCVSVCPMNQVDYATRYSSYENSFLGLIKEVYTGHSHNPDIRFSSSSGGFIRELSASLLQEKKVDGIIALRHIGGLDYEPSIIHDCNEMPNSIYHNINFSNAIKILKENNGRYAIIGLPCQLISIDLFLSQEKNRGIQERCVLKVSLICGYSFERNNFIALAEWNKISLANITYRNGGKYRSFRITGNDGSIREFPTRPVKNIRSVLVQNIIFDRFHAQNGCLWCVDHLGYCADIVVGDAWLHRYESDTQGTNLIIVRTPKGADTIKTLKNMDLIPGSIEDILESQGVYAKGEIGEGMKKQSNLTKFHPVHKRSSDSTSPVEYSFRFKDRFKMKIIKPALRQRHYWLVKICYGLLEWRMFIIYFVEKSGINNFIIRPKSGETNELGKKQ